MNILIKNADFSAVSIGQAGIVERTSLLTHVYFIDNTSSKVAGIDYSSNDLNILCYDVSALEGKTVKITGKVGAYNSSFARFYSEDAISQDTSYTSSDEVATLNDYFGSPLQTYSGEKRSMKTVIVEVPVGAKSLCVYGDSHNIADECSLVELL